MGWQSLKVAWGEMRRACKGNGVGYWTLTVMVAPGVGRVVPLALVRAVLWTRRRYPPEAFVVTERTTLPVTVETPGMAISVICVPPLAVVVHAPAVAGQLLVNVSDAGEVEAAKVTPGVVPVSTVDAAELVVICDVYVPGVDVLVSPVTWIDDAVEAPT